MESIELNNTNAKHWRQVAVLAVRIVGGVAAVGCFLMGLWSVWGAPGRGASLMGLGILLGVAFGRYPQAEAGPTRKKADGG